MNRALLGPVIGSLLMILGASPRAMAACTTRSNICSFADLNGCCGAGAICDVTGTVTLTPGATCLLDFGARSLNVLSGGAIVAGTGHATILATQITVKGNGRLSAAGDATHDGGSLQLGTALQPLTAFTLQNTALVDITGGGALAAGQLDITTSGAIDLQSGTVDATAIALAGNGGDIRLVSLAGNININARVWARSMSGATANGGGGTIVTRAAGTLTIQNDGDISARGAAGSGGTIDLRADGAALLQPQSTLDVSAYPGTEGDGGTIQVRAGSIEALGTMASDGGSAAIASEGGGTGGEIELVSSTGKLRVQHGTKGISAIGAPGGEGGFVTLTTQAMTNAGALPPTDGTLIVATVISVAAGATTLDSIGDGGEITVESSGDFLLDTGALVDISSGGGSAGSIDVTATRDATFRSSISGNSDDTGGRVDVDARHDLTFSADISLDGRAGTQGSGGDLTAKAGNDLRVTRGNLLSAKGATTSLGGSIDFRATQRLRVESAATLEVDGGQAVPDPGDSPSHGGTITLASNALDHGAPLNYPAESGDPADFPNFDLIIEGRLKATGRTTCPAIPNPNAPAGRIALVGCRVRLFNAVLDSSGDCNAENEITVRKEIAVNTASRIKTSATGKNSLRAKTGASTSGAPTSGLTFSPQFVLATSPECTATNTPLGCIVPCPTCGDLTTDGPWETCDNPDRCSGHCDHCRTEVCGNGNACLRDDCDPLGGCINTPLPDGTSCADDSVCTLVDQCQSGACVQEELPCNDGIPCTLDTCDAVTGCGHANNPGPNDDGTGVSGCDDQSFCNGDEFCTGSTCHAGTPPTCHEDPDDPDSRDFCLGTCQHEYKACTGVADCDDDNECTTDTCVPPTNPNIPDIPPMICRNTQLANGAACSDGNSCTGEGPGATLDSCQNGTCVRGSDRACNDGLVCTIDACDPLSGCVVTPVGGNCCDTVADCTGGTFCSTTECNPTTHECSYPPIENCCTSDAECDDQDPCTEEPAGICGTVSHACGNRNPLGGVQPGCGDDACQPGQCIAGICQLAPPTVCEDDGDTCTLEICDPVLGCQHPAIEGCCTTADDCTDDTNSCTEKVCTAAHLCEQQVRFTGCRQCTLDSQCDPSGRCAGQFCDETGVCRTTAEPNCRDGKINTEDVCTPVEGGTPVCTNRCLNATACDNGDACDGAETCNAGTCVPGTAPSRDDLDLCTDDSCDPGSGVVHAPRLGFSRIRCRLDEVEQRIGAASAADLQTSVRKKFTSLLNGVRVKLAKAEPLKDAGNNAYKKSLKAAVKQTRRFEKLIGKFAGKKIAAPLATSLTTALQDALGQINGQLP